MAHPNSSPLAQGGSWNVWAMVVEHGPSKSEADDLPLHHHIYNNSKMFLPISLTIMKQHSLMNILTLLLRLNLVPFT